MNINENNIGIMNDIRCGSTFNTIDILDPIIWLAG
jgi:hypothetical protein